jgi:hypothetical protein
MWKLILCALAAAAVIPAQQAAPAAPGSIGGQILDALEQPLNGATVILTPAGSAAKPIAFVTETRGLFLFENLRPGRYLLFAEHEGFARQAYGSRDNPLAGITLLLAPGEVINDLEFKLTPGAEIAGKVLGEDGKPVEGATVMALQPVYQRGKKEYIPVSAAKSEGAGAYRLKNLNAGQYLISATYREPADSAADAVAAERPEKRYTTAFFPDASSLSAAAVVNVAAGAGVAGKDIRMSRVNTFRVEGKLAKPPANALVAWLTPKGSGATGLATRAAAAIQPDGSFRFAGVAPGSYLLTATDRDGVTPEAAPLAVNVAATSVTGLTLEPAAGAELHGTVTLAAGTSVIPKGVEIVLEPADVLAPKPPRAAVGDDGQFTFKDMAPGRYYVHVIAPEPAYARSIRFAGADVTEKGITFGKAGGATLAIALSASGARVDGTVRGADGNPRAGAVVALVPAIRRYSLYKEATTDQNGGFEFGGLPPGEYKAYAWEQIASGQYQDPEWLKQFENKGQPLNLKAAGHEVVVLKAIGAAPAH